MQSFKRLVHSSFFKLSIKAGLTLLAFWFVFQGIDFAHLMQIVAEQDHMLLIETSLLMILQSILGGIRWRMITNALATSKAHCMSMMDSQKLYYIGVFFTTCLPGTVGGDVVRIWLAKGINIPLAQSINSVIIDRMIALFAIAIMVLFTLPVLAEVMEVDTAIIYPVTGVLAVGGLVLMFYLERLLTPYGRYKPVHWVLYFLRSLKLILTHPYVCLSAVSLALIAHVSYSLSAYVMAQSLGIPMTWMQSLAFIPLVMLVTTIPISFGGWGLREASMVGLLGLVGIQAEAALMLSIQLGLLFMVISIPAGVWWLLDRKKKPSDTEAAQISEAMGDSV